MVEFMDTGVLVSLLTSFVAIFVSIITFLSQKKIQKYVTLLETKKKKYFALIKLNEKVKLKLQDCTCYGSDYIYDAFSGGDLDKLQKIVNNVSKNYDDLILLYERNKYLFSSEICEKLDSIIKIIDDFDVNDNSSYDNPKGIYLDMKTNFIREFSDQINNQMFLFEKEIE
jgi:hypothetical protein